MHRPIHASSDAATHQRPHKARWTLRHRIAVTCALGVLIASCGGGDERPTDAVWKTTWLERQTLMPDADELAAGGADLCGELVGLFHAEMPDLRPTPTEALDAAVEAWVDHAETIVFECHHDPDDLAARFATLNVLAAEIDSGLAADD